MLITDAINEVIDLDNLQSDVTVKVNDNIVTIHDEFGNFSRMFTNNDPDLVSKVRRLWGDFLQRRSHKLMERMGKSNAEIWYETRNDEVMPPNNVMRHEDEETALAWANKYPGWAVFRMSQELIVPSESSGESETQETSEE